MYYYPSTSLFLNYFELVYYMTIEYNMEMFLKGGKMRKGLGIWKNFQSTVYQLIQMQDLLNKLNFPNVYFNYSDAKESHDHWEQTKNRHSSAEGQCHQTHN